MSETPNYTSVPDMPYGSRIVTIVQAGVPTAYLADNFNVTAPTKLASQNDRVGNDARFKLALGRKTATAQLQLETTATPLPRRGQEFDGEARDEVAKWVITEVGAPEETEGIRVVNISCVAK